MLALSPGALPSVALLAHLVLLGLIGWRVDRLAETLRPGTGLLAVILLAPAHAALGGVRTADALLLAREVALPLELLALDLLLRRRDGSAGLALGFAGALHAPSAAAFGVAMVCLRPAFLARRPLTLAALASAPAWLPWLPRLGAAGPPMTEAWWSAIAGRLPHHLLFSAFPPADRAATGAWLGLGLLASRRLRWGLLGLALWAAVVGALGTGLRLPLALQLEPWQATRPLILLAGLAVVGRLGSCLPLGQLRWRTGTLALGLLLAWLVGRQGLLGHSPARWEPGPSPRQVAAAAEVRRRVPRGELLAVPPVGYESIRWLAERPVTGTWKDGGEALFDPSLAAKWVAVMEVASGRPWSDAPSPGRPEPGADLAALRSWLDEGWQARGPAGRIEAARTLGAAWLLEACEACPGGVELTDLRRPGPDG